MVGRESGYETKDSRLVGSTRDLDGEWSVVEVAPSWLDMRRSWKLHSSNMNKAG